jgi:DNA (cytosine-5)-methyltransferase 1
MTQTNLNVIGLFAGVGGIELGFEKAGFEPLVANEIDAYAATTYSQLHKQPVFVADINDVTATNLLGFLHEHGVEKPELRGGVLTGGFPCQPFSVAGYRKGFEDPRGNVFWQIHRLINEIEPEVVFLENVKNLKGHDEGRTFETIIQALEGEISSPSGVKLSQKYWVKEAVLNAKDFGVPQNRERIFIVAFRDKAAFDKFEFPEPTAKTPSLDKFIDFDSQVDDKYYYTSARPFYSKLEESITEQNVIYQWRRQYVRANKSGVSPTLTANMGMGGHNVPLIKSKHGIRKLTPTECFRLMGFKNPSFPAGMAESRLYKQAGNAVVVNVIEAIAIKIKKAVSN